MLRLNFDEVALFTEKNDCSSYSGLLIMPAGALLITYCF